MARSAQRATNLPADTTSFVGRRRELLEVKRLLATTRLLTLTGPGGVGKTRLALRAASELARSFPDGLRLVELAALDDPTLLPNVVAGLGLENTSARWLVGALAEQLANKRLLMVVDNCEHLIDAVAVLIGSLLRTCPELRLLATSRQPLRLNGETTFRVPSLSLPPAESQLTTDNCFESEAIKLFVQRATAASPTFIVTEDNLPAIAHICHQLDGIPLALELAAVRVRSLALGDLSRALGDRFQLLIGGSPATDPRHQTLRATLDWSHALLTQRQQTLWQRLSVFVGGFDADAAVAVVGEDTNVLDLCALVEASILLAAEWNGTSRYQLSETIRQYGLELLERSGESAECRRRQREHYRALATRAEAAWLGSDNLTWLARVEADQGNFRAVLESCLTDPEATATGLEIATHLWMYWSARAHVREGRRWLEQLLERAPADAPQRARALLTLGVLCRVQGDYETAAARLDAAIAITDRTGDGEGHGLALSELAVVAAEIGATERATSLLERARTLVGKPGDRLHRSYVEYMASVLNWARQPYRAVQLMEEALALSESAGDAWRRAWALRGLGTAAWLLADSERAVNFVRASLRQCTELDDQRGIASCLETLGCIDAETHPEAAARYLGAASRIWQTTGGAPSPSWQPDRQVAYEVARRRLGDRLFESNLGEGARMPLKRMIAQTLGPDEPALHAALLGRIQPGGLSEREQEIAQLVADGLSNKEIAARLLISTRTVDTHVDHILKKLGLRSRAQVARVLA